MKKDVALLKSFVNFWKNTFNIDKETEFKEFIYAVFCNFALFISTFLIVYLLVEVLGLSIKIAAVYMLIVIFYLIVSIIPLITLIIRTVRQMKKVLKNRKVVSEKRCNTQRNKDSEIKPNEDSETKPNKDNEIKQNKDSETNLLIKNKVFELMRKYNVGLPYPMTPHPTAYKECNDYYEKHIKQCTKLFDLKGLERDYTYTSVYVAIDSINQIPCIISERFSDYHISFTGYGREDASFEFLNELAKIYNYQEYTKINKDNWLYILNEENKVQENEYIELVDEIEKFLHYSGKDYNKNKKIYFYDGWFICIDEKGNSSIISHKRAREMEADYRRRDYNVWMDIQRGGESPEEAYKSRGFILVDGLFVPEVYYVDRLVRGEIISFNDVLYIPEFVNGIKIDCVTDYAFEGTDIREVYIPKTVKVISWTAFIHCEMLERICIEDAETDISFDNFISKLNSPIRNNKKPIIISAPLNSPIKESIEKYSGETNLIFEPRKS